jgi:uncharacterized protein (TIGR00266 family)
METNILYQPAFAMTEVTLGPKESVRVEGGAMVSMDSDLEIQTGATGGFMQALKRSALGRESFFMNTFTASDRGGKITVAASLPGDMLVLQLANEEYKVQAGGYIASSTSINVDTKWGGARAFFGGDGGLFMLQCTGSGTLILASYGALHKITLGPGQQMTMDTGHLVAFTKEIGFNVRRVGGWKSTFLSGEGLVVDLTGPGDIYMQSRSQESFLSWLIPNLPTETR